MGNENGNPFIAYVESRIAAWQAVLAPLKAAVALDATPPSIDGIDLQSTSVSGDIGQPIDLPSGAFLGKSIPACVKLYLSTAKKKKPLREIAMALREGGVETNSDNFENTVYSSLTRLRSAGDVLKFKDGWGLSAWYPANLRAAAPTPGKQVKKKAKHKKRAKNSSSAAPVPKDEPTNVAEISKPEDKPFARIVNFFKTNSNEVTAKDVANELGVKVQVAALLLGRLANQNKIQKLSSGKYKAGSLSAAS